MNFDPERYREDLAPLNLPREKEDELLHDCWQLMQVLIDQMSNPDFYPLHLAIAEQAFDSLEEAILVESIDTENAAPITQSKEPTPIFNQTTGKEKA